LPSNLRPITREYVHLVTRGYFRSRDKNGGHTNQSATFENLMIHANFMALCFIEPKLLPIEVLHFENRDFRFFCSCDLDLDPTTFIYELDPHSLEIYRICKYELTKSRLSKVIVWQTDTTEIIYHATSRVVYKLTRNSKFVSLQFHTQRPSMKRHICTATRAFQKASQDIPIPPLLAGHSHLTFSYTICRPSNNNIM